MYKETQIPYDKCKEIDKEIEELNSKQHRKNLISKKNKELKEEGITKNWTLTSILFWLGLNFTLEYISGIILEFILSPFIAIALFLSDSNNENEVKEVIKWLFHPSIREAITKKMSKKNYMISVYSIDAPISIKIRLLLILQEDNQIFIKKVGSRLLTSDESFEFNGQLYMTNQEEEYFLSQLEEDRIYIVSQIITDKEVK